MMGRMTLREVRENLVAAKAQGTTAPLTAPFVEELELLARLLEREAQAGVPHLERAAARGYSGGARPASE